MNKYTKITHWILFFSVLGLITTSLSADFFFSKEAIVKSFQFSMPEIGANIAPVDQLFLAKIERRIPWDYHFYFGVLFSFSLIYLFLAKNSLRKSIKNIKLHRINMFFIYITGIIMFVTGYLLYSRLFFHMSSKMFVLLKLIHDDTKWVFLAFIIMHIATIIYYENTKIPGIISYMFKNKSVNTFLLFSILMLTTHNLYAKDMDNINWLKDQNFINGMLYLNGKRGEIELTKQIANCPYAKCRKSNVNKNNPLNLVTIKVDKPNYKKAVALLYLSAKKGNLLAGDKLISFLVKRVNYKNYEPDKYLLKLLKKDTGLNFKEYKQMLVKIINIGSSSKSCIANYMKGELLNNGYLNQKINKSKAKIFYKKAVNYCPKNNIYYFLATSKIPKG